MKEYFDYKQAYDYGMAIGDVNFVSRAEAFTLQVLTNEFPAAIKTIKHVRAVSDNNRFEYVMTTYGGMLLIGIRQYGGFTEALVEPETGIVDYYYYDDYDDEEDEEFVKAYCAAQPGVVEYTSTY